MAEVKKFESAGGAGRLANRRGTGAVAAVEAILRANGYTVARRVPLGEGIYGTGLPADLVVENSSRWPEGLIIEVISQQSSGSADHKFPYVVANIKQRYPCATIIVLVGHGFGKGALEWLREQVDGQKLVDVVSIEQFEAWVAHPLAG